MLQSAQLICPRVVQRSSVSEHLAECVAKKTRQAAHFIQNTMQETENSIRNKLRWDGHAHHFINNIKLLKPQKIYVVVTSLTFSQWNETVCQCLSGGKHNWWSSSGFVSGSGKAGKCLHLWMCIMSIWELCVHVYDMKYISRLLPGQAHEGVFPVHQYQGQCSSAQSDGAWIPHRWCEDRAYLLDSRFPIQHNSLHTLPLNTTHFFIFL